MKIITGLTTDPNQNMKVSLDDGTLFSLSLVFSSNQQGWFYSLIYGSFSVNNRRLVTSPNMLRSLRTQIPFGINCVSYDGREPIYLTDFTSGRITLCYLNQSDVALAEVLITETIPAQAGVILN